MRLANLLTLLEDIEHKMSLIYRKWSEQLKDNQVAAAFFEKMSNEELSHRNILKLERSLVFKDKKAIGTDVEEVTEEEIRRIIEELNKEYQSDTPITFKEALQKTVDFEAEFCQNHHSYAVKQVNPEIARLIKSLGTKDEVHFEAAKKFAEDMGVEVKTKEIDLSQT